VDNDKATTTKARKEWPKKKKFRYETKLERSLGGRRQKPKRRQSSRKSSGSKEGIMVLALIATATAASGLPHGQRGLSRFV